MTESPPYTEHDATVGGLKLHYQEWGDPKAPAILMLHGFGVSGHMFDEFAARMQERYRLIALDQRGHGDSDWSDAGNYTRDAFVEDVEGFRKALGLDRFVLAGHSMGGLNAVSYTTRYPAQVSSLILVDVGPEAAKDGVDNIVRFTQGPDELDFEEFVALAHRFNQRRTIENIRERMRHRLKPMGDNGKWTWKFDARFRQKESGLRIGSELSTDQLWQLYRDIRVPTLLVRGAESDVLTQETAERAVREMRLARLAIVPGAGHSVPGDSPDAFTEAVKTFLDDVAAGKFGPAVSIAPPPLAELVTVQQRAARRRAGITAGIIAAAGALIVLTGLLVAKRKPKQVKQARAKTRRAAKGAADAVDLAAARDRAVQLAEELSAVGKRNASRGRKLLHEADVTRARAEARAVLAALGDHVPSGASHAAATLTPARVKAKGRAAVKDKKKRKRGAGRMMLSLALATPKLLAAGRTANELRKRGPHR